MQTVIGALKSKTVWFNVLGFAGYALAWPQLNQYISAAHLGMITTAIGVALRVVTTDALSAKA